MFFIIFPPTELVAPERGQSRNWLKIKLKRTVLFRRMRPVLQMSQHMTRVSQQDAFKPSMKVAFIPGSLETYDTDTDSQTLPVK